MLLCNTVLVLCVLILSLCNVSYCDILLPPWVFSHRDADCNNAQELVVRWSERQHSGKSIESFCCI